MAESFKALALPATRRPWPWTRWSGGEPSNPAAGRCWSLKDLGATDFIDRAALLEKGVVRQRAEWRTDGWRSALRQSQSSGVNPVTLPFASRRRTL
jgi:hypothetical protein